MAATVCVVGDLGGLRLSALLPPGSVSIARGVGDGFGDGDDEAVYRLAQGDLEYCI